jgi:hypothetical protein
MFALLLLLDGAADAAMAVYRQKTAAEQRCRHDPASTDITVCGLRNADRFRVPFVSAEPGDPRVQNVPVERERLLYRRTPVQDMGPFLVGGGHVGVSYWTRGGLQAGEARRLAP